MNLELQPITFQEANEFVRQYHRHHGQVVGCKFCIAVNNGEKVVGVVIVGRPVARHYDDGWTAEVTRLCTDGTHNAASILYSAAWRAARAMGYKRMITYTLDTELGTSVKAAGWKILHQTSGGSWNCQSRPRVDKASTQPKICWEAE